MTAWSTAQLIDIETISDGRVPWRPVRHHFGITSFGLNVFTGDEADDAQEERYFLHSGRGRFELADEVRGMAETDTDLDTIRDEPAFKELVAAR